MDATYKGRYTREISFPVGGIGTGCIGLAGDGRLIDWEIFNRPSKGSRNGFSHFAIKAEDGDTVLDARVLHGDFSPPYTGELTVQQFGGFGFGPRRENLAGMPHFQGTEFVGEFPVGTVRFLDDSFPAAVTLSAFNPFIPLAEDESSLPAAFFEITVRNTTRTTLRYTVAGSLSNPAPPGNSNHAAHEVADGTILTLDAPATAVDSPDYGGLALALAHQATQSVSYQQYWYRGNWFDGLGVYWRDFASCGPFKNRTYEEVNAARVTDTATLAAHVTLSPGESASVRFLLSWHYPNCCNYWSQPQCCDGSSPCEPPATWRNYYATLYGDARDVAMHGLKHWDCLEARTRAFKEALFGSTLPAEVLDAVSANISILKSPTCLRLTDGSFYGFEGCHSNAGCCEGSCTHVWNYAYALPFLFPRLERSMRELDYTHNQREDGEMSFRLQLPIGSHRLQFRACVDGQMGGVIKTYREWKLCGDDEWLRGLWPAVKRSVEFAWARTNEDRWDPDKAGVVTGRQHHTLDMELFGPNSWLTGFYLAALKAAAEMAEYLGEEQTSAEYRRIFERGKAWVNRELYNGEYYQQVIDLNDKTILESFSREGDQVLKGGNVVDAYWDSEHGEIKYQIGDGSVIDQVIAQWHANLNGLGEIFDPEQTTSALRAIYQHNYKQSVRSIANPCRTYCLNDEAGAIICEWPKEKYKPFVPLTYSEETMHGYEYQVACHMIQDGLVDEGLQLVRAVRDRYDGERRNPWNEIECGSNYARSMASYALLLAYSGFSFDLPNGMIGFDPIVPDNGLFRCFWSVDGAWGTFAIEHDAVRLEVAEGDLTLQSLGLFFLQGIPATVSRCRNERTCDVPYVWDCGLLGFDVPLDLVAGDALEVRP